MERYVLIKINDNDMDNKTMQRLINDLENRADEVLDILNVEHYGVEAYEMEYGYTSPVSYYKIKEDYR